MCGLTSGTKNSIFSSLEQDTQDLDSLSSLINIEPLHDYPPLPGNVYSTTENDTPIVLTQEEVHAYLNRITSGKSSGPDNLANWTLRRFADILAAPVMVILNASLRKCRVPSLWN